MTVKASKSCALKKLWKVQYCNECPVPKLLAGTREILGVRDHVVVTRYVPSSKALQCEGLGL